MDDEERADKELSAFEDNMYLPLKTTYRVRDAKVLWFDCMYILTKNFKNLLQILKKTSSFLTSYTCFDVLKNIKI